MGTAELAENACIPCKGGVPPLTGAELTRLHEQLNSDWELVNDHHLTKEYRVQGYGPAVEFANKVAAIADAQDHHPDITFSWGKVIVTIWTHKIDGLTESDFYFAAKTEEAFKEM